MKFNNPSPIDGLQVPVNLPILPGMTLNGRDIRILDFSGKPVPYYIESADSGNIFMYIKMPANTEKLWLYYGNGAAKPVSSGKDTFEFWDDFEKLDNAVWTKVWGASTVSNGRLLVGGNSLNNIIETKQTFGYNSIMEARAYRPVNNGYQIGFRSTASEKRATWYTDSTCTNVDIASTYNGSDGTYQNDINRGGTTFYLYGVAHLNDSARFYVNYELRKTITTTLPATSLPVQFYSQVGRGDVVVDWVRVRKYSASMPSMTLGRKYINQQKRYPFYGFGTGGTVVEMRPQVFVKRFASVGTKIEMRPKVAIRRPLFYHPSFRSSYPNWKFEGEIEIISESRPALVHLPILPNMTLDGRDIRITDLYDNDLEFNIETSTQDYHRIWVDAPDTENRLKFYYGNGAAVSVSNPAIIGEPDIETIITPYFAGGTPGKFQKWKFEGEYVLSGTATGGEQILISVPRLPNMTNDGRDLRFIDPAGNSLNYFIESVSSSEFSVWIKLTTGIKKFKLYYGNGTAKPLSSASLVFDFIDDFEVFDTNEWQVLNGSASASNGILSIGSTTLNSMVQSTSAFAEGHILEIYALHPDGNEFYRGFWNVSSGKRAVFKPSTSSPYNDSIITHNGSTQISNPDGVNRSGAYHLYTYKYEVGKVTFYADGNLRRTETSIVPSGALTIGFYSTVNKGNCLVDYVRVRKITSLTASLKWHRSRSSSLYFEEISYSENVPEIKIKHRRQGNQPILYYEGIKVGSVVGMRVSEPTVKIRRELRDYAVSNIEVIKSINDSYTQLSTEFLNRVYPPEKSTIKHNAYDKEGNPYLLFFGKIQTNSLNIKHNGITVSMQAADQTINLSAQKIPWSCLVIDGEKASYSEWILRLLEPLSTGVYPNTIIDTGKEPTQIILDAKTSRLEAIKKIAEYTGCVYLTKLITRTIEGAQVTRPEFYFVPPEHIDDDVNGFDLPAPLVLTNNYNNLVDEPKLISEQEEKYNKVTVSGTLSETGEFVTASAFSYKVHTGEEPAREYFIEDNTISEKGSTAEREAIKWLLYFLVPRAKVTMRFVNKFDLELYQRIKFGNGSSLPLQQLTQSKQVNEVVVYDPRDPGNSTHIVDVSKVPRPEWLRISELRYHSSPDVELVDVTAITDFIYSAKDNPVPAPYSQYLSPGYMKPIVNDLIGTTESIVEERLEKQLTPESGTVLSIDTEKGTAVVQLASGKIVTVDLA